MIRLTPVLQGNDVEHFLDSLADLVKSSAATRAGLVLDIDHHIEPRKMKRQPAAIAARLSPCDACRCCRLAGRVRLVFIRRTDVCSRVFRQQQLKLIGVLPLRTPSEQRALVLRQNEQELFVLLQSGVTLGDRYLALVRKRAHFR